MRYRCGRVRIPVQFLDTVSFVCVKTADGQYRYGGTGFFVAIDDEINPSVYSWMYLVTARHCVARAEQHGGLFARLNTLQGASHFLKLDSHWSFPTNDASDLAIIPVGIRDPTRVKPRAITADLFATDQVIAKRDIGIGDDLVIVGLFTERVGQQRNRPIVRSAMLSALADEPMIDSATGLEYSAYIAEARSIGGLSGSPVFVALGPNRVTYETDERQMPRGTARLATAPAFYLLGIVRHHWDYAVSGSNVGFGLGELQAVNMGLAAVTPVADLVGLLHREDLVKWRRAASIERERRLTRKASDPDERTS